MSRWIRVPLVVAALALVVVSTGFVMARNRKMSLFLEAGDRIERGDPLADVLADLEGEIDWPAAPPGLARRVAEEIGAAPDGSPVLHRAGDHGLLRVPKRGLHLVEKIRSGWKEIR